MHTWITIDEATEQLQGRVSRSTLYRAANSGQIPSLRIGRRILLDNRWFGTTSEAIEDSIQRSSL